MTALLCFSLLLGFFISVITSHRKEGYRPQKQEVDWSSGNVGAGRTHRRGEKTQMILAECWFVSHLPQRALWRLRTTARGSGAGTARRGCQSSRISQRNIWPAAPSNDSDVYGKRFLAIVKPILNVLNIQSCKDIIYARWILTGHLQLWSRSTQEISYPFQSSSLSFCNWTQYKLLTITNITGQEGA